MRRKVVVFGVVSCAITGIAAVLMLGSLYQPLEGPSPIGPRADQLDAWVAEGAGVAKVRSALTGPCSHHRLGERTWAQIVAYLEKCQHDLAYDQVRAAMGRSTELLLHATDSQMTWILFDEHGAAKQYFTTAPNGCRP